MGAPSTRDHVLVRSANDPEQVKRAAKREQYTRDDELNDIRAVMSTYQGRRDRWHILTMCGLFESVYGPEGAIYYQAGQRDLGHRLLNDIMDADADLYLLMQREAIDRKKRVIEPERAKTDDTDETSNA